MDKGLKKNAIGYLSNIVIGVASTAPAYSLAATLGESSPSARSTASAASACTHPRSCWCPSCRCC